MTDEVRLLGAAGVALTASLVATPIARRIAVATHFYDRPAGYKAHTVPIPYLGGVGVLAGFVIAALLFADAADRFAAALAASLALLAIGILDDRVGLGIAPRLATQIAAAAWLWAADLGWSLFDSDAADLAVTLVWTAGLANAFNLMDNLDGAAGTVGMVGAFGAGLIAAENGDAILGALALALAGALAGFLPSNLAKPPRIFLGDGGSMPVGLLMAVIVMGIPDPGGGSATLLAGIPIAGLAILDTALVVISRWRRGVPLLSGGRDHLTHRLLPMLGNPRRVSLALGGVQALLCGTAALLYGASVELALAGCVAYTMLGLTCISVLESPRFLPDATAGGTP